MGEATRVTSSAYPAKSFSDIGIGARINYFDAMNLQLMALAVSLSFLQ